MDDFRKVFDQNVAPEDFDKWRTRYCGECFADVIAYSRLGPGSSALEIGPGTGQATEPILKTGCSYLAIELGENFTSAMKERFGRYANFDIVNDDFETHDFGQTKFDLVYSAATIQWIPEEIGFPKVYSMLKPGGTFAMMATATDFKSANEDLYAKIQESYDKYFHPGPGWKWYQDRNNVEYTNVTKYGFSDFEKHEYYDTRVYNADEFLQWTMIQAPHLTLQEPDRSNFVEGVRDAIMSCGGQITLRDTVLLFLARKP